MDMWVLKNKKGRGICLSLSHDMLPAEISQQETIT